MSRMIPPRYDEATVAGERRIFRALEQLSDDYTVFHSLGLSNHSYQVYGEVDFVILCTQGVLCLEVKGGNVHRDQGTWVHTTRHGDRHESAKSPFVQVIGAANALRDDVKNRFGPRNPVSRCCYASGVMFPEVSFNLKSPENIPEIVYSVDTPDLEVYIKQVFTYWRKQLLDKHGFEPERLSRGNMDSLSGYLRGNFGFVSSLGTALTQTEEELIYLTDEQKKCLQMIQGNQRIMLEGGAGTGKTLLSMEQAVARASEGERVLFLCFNRNLAYYLQHHVAMKHPHLVENLHVQVFHQLLEDYLTDLDQAPDNPQGDQNAYWTQELPSAFADAVDSLGYPQEYDYLVIDEGQDLLQIEYLMCLEPLLKGRFEQGQWLVVYDLNQNLYGISIKDALDYLLNCRPARFSLAVNCRNTRQIIEFTAKATKVDSKQELQADGPVVKSIPYKNLPDQKRLLIKELKKMLSQNIRPQDICVLSARRLKNSGLEGDTIVSKGTNIQDIGGLAPAQWDEDSIRFSTLYRFKGLESPVIVFIDVNSFEDEHRIRNYSAMTRAKSILYVFHSETAAGLDQLKS